VSQRAQSPENCALFIANYATASFGCLPRPRRQRLDDSSDRSDRRVRVQGASTGRLSEERQQREAEFVGDLRDAIDAGLWTGTLTVNETASGSIVGPTTSWSSEATSVTLKHSVTLTVDGSSVCAHVTYARTE
jgi:hypothetical protein